MHKLAVTIAGDAQIAGNAHTCCYNHRKCTHLLLQSQKMHKHAVTIAGNAHTCCCNRRKCTHFLLQSQEMHTLAVAIAGNAHTFCYNCKNIHIMCISCNSKGKIELSRFFVILNTGSYMSDYFFFIMPMYY